MDDKMLKGKGKFNIYGSKAVISIPSNVWKDSQYPFRRGENVEIEIVGDELKIRKIVKESENKSEKKVVLVVDDEEEVHELLREYLSGMNIEIYSAYNGEEGVKLYRKLMKGDKKPALVVMDLNLSGSKKLKDMIKHFMGEEIDGVKATRQILKMDPDAKIVGFTAFAHLEWGKKLREAGVENVFGREIGFEGFAKRISEILA